MCQPARRLQAPGGPRGWLWGLALALACAACAGTPTPPPSAQELLSHSAQVMAGLRSVHFTIERSGAPAYVDPDEVFVFRRAQGDFVAPDQTRATVRIIGPAIVADVSVVALGDRYWETNPVTGEWASYLNAGYNPAALLDPNTGLTALMRQDLADLTYAGLERLEDLPGSKLFHLKASGPGEPVAAVTDGLIGRGRVAFDWWIEPDTGRVLRLRLVEPETDPADPSVWLVDFDRFDTPVTIEPPV